MTATLFWDYVLFAVVFMGVGIPLVCSFYTQGGRNFWMALFWVAVIAGYFLGPHR